MYKSKLDRVSVSVISSLVLLFLVAAWAFSRWSYLNSVEVKVEHLESLAREKRAKELRAFFGSRSGEGSLRGIIIPLLVEEQIALEEIREDLVGVDDLLKLLSDNKMEFLEDRGRFIMGDVLVNPNNLLSFLSIVEDPESGLLMEELYLNKIDDRLFRISAKLSQR